MKKLVFYGAGDASLRAIHLLNKFEYEIIAFLDDDLNKQGTKLKDIPILSPDALHRMEFDFVVISIIHENLAKNRLVNQLNVEPNKIIDWYFNDIFDVRVASMRLAAEEIYENKIIGNVAELGVYKGEFAKYINAEFIDKTIYLFDTFRGFDLRDVKVELENNYSSASEKDFNNDNIDLVLSKMMYRENCKVVEGYFPESASRIDDIFSFVSIDVDLFKPIYEGLKWFYPRMSKGGFIFVHDVNGLKFSGAKEAVKLFCEENKKMYVSLPDVSGTVIIRKD